MCQIVMVVVGHLLILSLVLFGFWLSHRYISRRFIRSSIHCPTQLALKGQYEAPPRGWNVLVSDYSIDHPPADVFHGDHWTLSNSDS